jgi:hypothetical protein
VEIDRYTKFVLTVIALALSTLAFKDIVAPQPAVAAARTEEVQQLNRANLYEATRSSITDCLDGATITESVSPDLTGTTLILNVNKSILGPCSRFPE